MEPAGKKWLLKKIAGALLMLGIATGTAGQGNRAMGTETRDQKTAASSTFIGNSKADSVNTSKILPAAVTHPATLAAAASETGSEDAKAAERKRRADIREALLADARDRFATLAPLANTGYAAQLDGMQRDLNAYLKRNPSFNGRTVVLHPDEFDAATAIGIGPRDAIRGMLSRQGIDADPNMLASIANHMKFGYESKFGLSGYTQDAETQPNVGTGADKAYVVIPNSNHADANPVPGLAYKDNIDFFNNHEGWHTKDSWYDMTKFSPQAQAASMEWNPDALTSTEAREAFAMQTRKEALGDVGSIGDMIRSDRTRTTDIITNVANWRRQDPFDVQHLSAPVLEGLKADIDKMGIAAFRKLDEQHVRAFYHDVVEKYGMNEKSVKRALDYDCADDTNRRNMEQLRDPDAQKGVAFARMKNADPAAEDADIPLTADQQRAKSSLDKYNPAKALEDRAFKLHGKITPATFIEAYGQLEEELRQKALREPSNALYPLQMTKLQESFVDIVKRTDYVAINRRHGVTIEDQEPGLTRFSAPANPPAGAAPPQADPGPRADVQSTVKKVVAPKASAPG